MGSKGKRVDMELQCMKVVTGSERTAPLMAALCDKA